MKKNIGTRILVMLLAMSIMYLVTAVSSGYAQEQALGGMNRIHDSWTQLERIELEMVKNLESNKLYANMIVWMQVPDAQKSMAAQSTGELVEALVVIKGEADTNREISQDLQGEVSRFKKI